MERPNSPSIEPSEPEKEQMLFDSAMEKLDDGNNLAKINLTAAYEFLRMNDFDLDEEGFIVDADTGEYAVPYAFSEKAFEEHFGEIEDVFDDFFVPRDDEDARKTNGTKERLHLSDLHSIFTDADGETHPVEDTPFHLEDFHRNTKITFGRMTGWSDAFKRAHMQGFQDEVKIIFNTFASDFEDEGWEINCFAPECGFSAHPDEWDGEENEPECPECGSEWDEDVTVCMACQEWHMGKNFVGEGMYSEPACPHCEASMSYLETQTRYDEFEQSDDAVL